MRRATRAGGGVGYAARRPTAAVLVLLGAALVPLAGCAALGKVAPYPEARITGVDVDGITLSALTLRFDVEVENPYTVDLPMVGLDYVLSTAGKQFLDGTLGLDQTVPAGEKRTVAMPVRVPFVELYEVVTGIDAGDTVPYHADMDLKVRAPVVGTVKLPLEADGSITVPSVPSFLRKGGR